jgi:hypothetical protein
MAECTCKGKPLEESVSKIIIVEWEDRNDKSKYRWYPVNHESKEVTYPSYIVGGLEEII